MIFLVLIIIFIFLQLYLFSHFPAPKKPSNKETFDAILVLGCPCNEDGNLSVMQKKRMDVAIKSFHKYKAHFLLLSGGSIHNAHNEAMCMKDYALSKQIPFEAILLENQARNTYENMKLSKPICIQKNIHKLLIITSHFHLKRSAYFARKFFVNFKMEAPQKKEPIFTYVDEYFRLWNTLYYEHKLKKMQRFSQE